MGDQIPEPVSGAAANAVRQQRMGSRTGAAREPGVEREAGAEPTDAEILDWLQTYMKRKGAWHTMHLSDSRDMGYKKGFVSFFGSLPEGKGNSVREAIGAAMVGAGWKRSRSKPRHSATDGTLQPPGARKPQPKEL